MDWAEVFGVHTPLTELVLRGSIMYWFLFLVFRFVMRRDVGAMGIADVLLLVIIADAAQNAMAGGYGTVTEGVVLVSTLMGWNLLLDALAFHFPAVARFAEPSAILLVQNGRVLGRNLRKEFVTRDELQSQLRQQGIEEIGEVKQAWMESDGQISVIKRRSSDTPKARGRQPGL